MERPGSSSDPRLNHDDPLLDGLLILCKLHGCSASRGSLSAGLPLPEQRLTPELLPCEADGGEQWVSREQLANEYSGQAFFARPRHELEEARSPLVPRIEAWFRDTLKLSRWLYTDAILAS